MAEKRDTVWTLDTGVEDGILRAALVVIRHWAAVAAMALVVFAGLPVLAPVLMAHGYTAPARLIYTVYRGTCHQEPHRSYFVGGSRSLYPLEEIERLTDVRPVAGYLGSPEVGYKMAYCQRDTATYTAMLLALMVLALVHRRLPRLSLLQYAVLLVPLAVDGLTQLVGWRESTWLLRTLTGGLFGVATAWLLYPHIDQGMREVAASLVQRRREIGRG